MIKASRILAATLSVYAALPSAFTTGPAFAQTPAPAATATGHYTDETGTIDFSHVAALALDSVDGQVDDDVKMRVVLSDRDVPSEALIGGAFPPIRQMARAGEIRGIMLEFDPADPTQLYLTPLLQPADPAESLATITMSASDGLWKSLSAKAGRISGNIVHGDNDEIEATFDTVVATNAVVAKLTGAAARSSEWVTILKQRSRALVEGDRETFVRLSTRASAAEYKANPMPPEVIKAFAAEMLPLYDKVEQVVVREHSAVVRLPEGYSANFIKEDGVWKAAD